MKKRRDNAFSRWTLTVLIHASCLHRNDRQILFVFSSDHRDRDRLTNRPFGQETMKIINAGNPLTVHGYDKVIVSYAGEACRAFGIR